MSVIYLVFCRSFWLTKQTFGVNFWNCTILSQLNLLPSFVFIIFKIKSTQSKKTFKFNAFFSSKANQNCSLNYTPELKTEQITPEELYARTNLNQNCTWTMAEFVIILFYFTNENIVFFILFFEVYLIDTRHLSAQFLYLQNFHSPSTKTKQNLTREKFRRINF